MLSAGLPALPVGIHLPAQPRPAEGIALQVAGEHGDGGHQQQPIDPLRAAEAAVCQLEDARSLISEQQLILEAPAVAPDHIQVDFPAAQAQTAHLASQKRCGAMDLGVAALGHHGAPAGPAEGPGQEFIAGEGTIGQQLDRLEAGQKPLGLLQPVDRERRVDAGTGLS